MKKRDTDEFLSTMRRRFAIAEEQESQLRLEAREDIRFVVGEQWDHLARAERERNQRPALVFNRLPAFVQQVANEARQNPPNIKFSPAEDGDKDTAEIYEGLARHIQYASNADIAYQTAIEYSAMGGFGYFRVLTDYCRANSFDQEIRFAPIVDPFSVFGVLYPSMYRLKVPWCFVITDISEEDFKAQYPDAELTSGGFDWGAGRAPGWVMSNSVRIAEYWYIEPRKRKLVLLSDGSSGFADEMGELPPDVKVERSREVIEDRVRFVKTNGVEILEETEWAGQAIPIFGVLGRLIVVDERPQLLSLVRFMRDPQRLINFYKSGIAESIGLSSRAPYIGAEGQFEGHEEKWATANAKNYAFLEYNPVSLGGQMVPPPQRQTFEAPIQALSIAAAQEVDDLKAIAGIYDASLGAQGNETSGVAIGRRQAQAGLTNLHFADNLHRAQEAAGRELAYLIPRVYDTERQVRILGEDEQQRVVRVNAQYTDEQGKPQFYDLGAGEYDVVVKAGPAYSTRREEAFDMLTQFAQSYPQLLQVGGDVIFRQSDIPGAEQIADRLERALPPGLRDDKDGQQKQQIPPEVLQQMQQADQMIQQLTAELHSVTDDVRTKRLELESRERIVTLQTQARLIETQAKIGSQEGIEMLRQEIAGIGQRLQMLNVGEPVTGDEQGEPGEPVQEQAPQQRQPVPEQQPMPEAA